MLRVEQRKILKGSLLNTVCFNLNLCVPRLEILTLLFASQLDLRGV